MSKYHPNDDDDVADVTPTVDIIRHTIVGKLDIGGHRPLHAVALAHIGIDYAAHCRDNGAADDDGAPAVTYEYVAFDVRTNVIIQREPLT